MIIDYPWYAVLLCLLAGALYAGVLYFVGRRRFSGWLLWLLTSLRFLAVSAIAFLLCAPMARQKVHERQQPRVDLIEDCSLSVQTSADSAFTLKGLYDVIAGQCQAVRSADAGNPMQTDLGAMLDAVPPDAAAIVLASDGIYNHGSNPVTVAERLGIPVYTVALGDTTQRRDAALADMRCNRIAMLGNNFPIELTVNATLLRGYNATLSISDAAGRRLFSQSIAYNDDDFSTAISASLPAENAGLQRYTVRLDVADGEVSAENNILTFYVDVIDARRKVAVFANAPHPDLAALKRSIESNPNYEANIIMADDMAKGKARFDADDYSMAVLHNLPSRTHTDIRYADGLPQLFVIGLQTDLARFNALHSGLEIVAKSNKSNEVTAMHQDAFTLFHLADHDAEAIEALPPLSAPFGEARMAEGVQMLFTARLGNIDSRQPLVAATSQGQQRRAFVWGEGLWRWRLMDYQASSSHEHFDRLVSQLVAFTAMQQKRDRLQVLAERSYAAGEMPVLRAQLYNEAYELTNSPEVKLTLTGDSLHADYTFVREGQAYRLALPDLGEGLYRYKATTDDGLTAEGSFAVEAINLELRRLTADHTLLRTISATTGGRMFYPDQMDELRDELKSLKPIIYTHTRHADFLRLPLVLALIILLLAAEWVLRKYHGEV